LTTTPAVTLRSQPITALQSIDKRWVALGYSESPLLIDIYDTENPLQTPTSIQIPENLVSDVNGKIEIVDWASDNKAFLAKYNSGDITEYLLVDRENPALARNLNVNFENTSYEISFRDRNKNEFFVYLPSTQSLFTASLSAGVSPTPFAVKVGQHKTFANDWLLYITSSDEEGLVEARFKRGDEDISA
jgi:hypothetical protein